MVASTKVQKTPYKKGQPSLPKKNQYGSQKIAKSFNIDNKTDLMAIRQCFATVKDHKDDFKINTKYRLFNPTKSEAHSSKQLYSTIN